MLVGVGLTLHAGEHAFVGGANGAGKTTLLRILCGLLAPDAGEVELAGRRPEQDRRAYQRCVSYLGAGNAGLYARLTVAQHLELWARLMFVAPQETPGRVAGVVDAFALDELRHRRVDRLSMGQRQRLRLAMAFLPPARLLLLDEPLTSLDRQGADLLRAALQQRLAAGASAIWCAPDRDAESALVPDLDLVMHEGDLHPR